MWLPNDGRPSQCPVSVWDREYERDRERWLNDPTYKAEHAAEQMRLIGDVRGKDVVDIGGGPLLCRPVKAVGGSLFVVDYSPIACELASLLGAGCWNVGAIEFLNQGTKRFDVAVSFGTFDYLPPGSLNVLFDRCPAPILVLGLPNGESYLQYKDRTCQYSREDVLEMATKHEWKLEELERERRSHTWARFSR